MPELTTSEEISELAFGFMASKALFAALHHGLFTQLAGGPLTAEEAATACGIHPEGARTLMTSLTACGVLTSVDGRFGNGQAAQAFLVKGARFDFGDYLRLQVDRQMYRMLDQIDEALAGELPEGATDGYADWFSDPAEARLYSESQHAGSLGPARGLSRTLDLSAAKSFLDVGGGTGAYAITFCQANPALEAVIVDFPNVAAVGREKAEAAGLSDRIRWIEGDALHTDWPDGQDVILMSYLFSGVPGDAQAGLIRRAWDTLNPGGRLLVHDFVVRGDRTGPKLAALWQLQHTAFTPGLKSLDEAWLDGALWGAGFEQVSVTEMIPAMTMLAQGVKPG